MSELAELQERIRVLENEVVSLQKSAHASALIAKSAQDRIVWVTDVLERVQSLAKIGYFALDLQTNRFEWSDQVFQMFERDPSLGPPSLEEWRESIPSDDLELLREKLQDVLSGQTVELEHRIMPAGGSMRWVTSHTRAQFDDGIPIRIIGTIQDITHRRNLEDQVQQSSKLEAVGRLAGGVAHDFNNLLTAIVSFTEFAIEQAEHGSGLHEDLTEVLNAAGRASELTSRLLAFSRRKSVAPRVISVNDVVNDVARLLERIIGENIIYHTELSPDVRPTRVDPGALEQILVNLAINARDAMPSGGQLRISTETRTVEDDPEVPAGDYVAIDVIDSGVGIEANVMKSIFEPFFTTKDQSGGTGLGLSMVYGLVRQADGFMRVFSEPGEGATFTVLLPAHDVDPQNAPAPLPSRSPSGGSEFILVVEDDHLVREIAVRALKRAGYRIAAASGPHEALQQMEESQPFDLLLTDVVMPEMNGRELAERFLERFPNVPVLFMSGYMEDSLTSMGVLPDGIRLIQKPYTPERLTNAVRETLDGKFEAGVYQ